MPYTRPDRSSANRLTTPIVTRTNRRARRPGPVHGACLGLLLALALSACGGSSDSAAPEPAGTQPPTTGVPPTTPTTPVAPTAPTSPVVPPPTGAGAVIGISAISVWDALAADQKARLTSSQRSFFLHQSVGGDLEDGAQAGGYKFGYADATATSLPVGLNGGLFASNNGDYAGKLTEFRNMAVANRGKLTLAIMKFGYADIVDTSLTAAQAAYLAAVQDIKAQGVRVLHVTPPLVYNSPGENAPKMQMRNWMMTTFPGDVIFDLQDVTSTHPGSGARCERGGSWEICDAVRSTAACPSLNQGVDAPSGQGHLCFNPHAQRFAKAFLYAIYRAQP